MLLFKNKKIVHKLLLEFFILLLNAFEFVELSLVGRDNA